MNIGMTPDPRANSRQPAAHGRMWWEGRRLALCLLLIVSLFAQADDLWVHTGVDGQPQVQLYFFWALTCPHCTAAHPHVAAIPQARPWVRLHMLELTRHPENVVRYQYMAGLLGQQATSVPAFVFCGEMVVGWDSDAATGAYLRQRLDACRARALAAVSDGHPSTTGPTPPGAGAPLRLPLLGEVAPGQLSLPVLTLVLAVLDAFNPCAFFVLLFLLSMLTHQRSGARMLLIGGTFVTVSGLMYFAFMAAWLNVFQLIGHLTWVTLAAGGLALFVGMVNVKDFFLFERGFTLSIPESRKPDLFRRARAILNAESLPAMLAATLFLAVAANFYELLCTAGFPMVYTRVLTLSEPSTAQRYLYLAAYNLIYVLPLAAIVVAFARTLGARKLSAREGRLLKLMSGLMMLGLGGLLLVAPQLISRVGVAFGLLAAAVGLTWLAARLTRPPSAHTP